MCCVFSNRHECDIFRLEKTKHFKFQRIVGNIYFNVNRQRLQHTAEISTITKTAFILFGCIAFIFSKHSWKRVFIDGTEVWCVRKFDSCCVWDTLWVRCKWQMFIYKMVHTNAPVNNNVYDFKYVGSLSKWFTLIRYSLYKWICIKTNHCQSVSKHSRLYLCYSCETTGSLLNNYLDSISTMNTRVYLLVLAIALIVEVNIAISMIQSNVKRKSKAETTPIPIILCFCFYHFSPTGFTAAMFLQIRFECATWEYSVLMFRKSCNSRSIYSYETAIM